MKPFGEAVRPAPTADRDDLGRLATLNRDGNSRADSVDAGRSEGQLQIGAARLDLDDMVIEAAPLPSTDLAGDVDA